MCFEIENWLNLQQRLTDTRLQSDSGTDYFLLVRIRSTIQYNIASMKLPMLLNLVKKFAELTIKDGPIHQTLVMIRLSKCTIIITSPVEDTVAMEP